MCIENVEEPETGALSPEIRGRIQPKYANAFVHIIAAITAYQINPFKPKRNLQLGYQLETTA